MASARGMVTVADARARALKKLLADQRDWAAFGGEDARLEIVLHPPTERVALDDQGAAIAWVHAWQSADAGGAPLEVTWGARQWSRVGAQTVPERCLLRGADAIAAFAGSTPGRDWRVLRDRSALVRGAFAARAASADALAAAIRTHGRALQQLAETDFVTLLSVVAWLVDHPASGWRIRQLPIRGIDTKWLEGHRAVVEGLHAAVSGRLSLGLREAPNLVRVRFLDPALRPGGLCDVIAPVEELAALDIAPSLVFVFENLETMFAMPDLTGAVVVHGGGYAAPRLRGIPWVHGGRVIYWGDLDSDGFAILHALRVNCTNVTSVLMDEETLLAHRDLWVPEPKPAAGVYPTLTAGEQRVLERIRSEGNVRLEQERIAWEYALPQLIAAHPVPDRIPN
ncbi:DUF3322 and DUF2220 domain-containing protein [Cryobacterium sp. PH29-G1]|uniref:Wadjet anti-phage system protein JetD domain-containing protein n=1 Tax=Cryobacterium sp. PH29-G1 TaxID=3046211 RepID=UPI0024B8A7D0|nr:DUF3322 and DUF2220 domain-containing protein [Cryobacterium sp. PH29-G1]MDJ0349536.1 DUF2220 family protein [Cryobacterium sp. PH29-G1]